jgi:hypothetical protein
MLAPTVLMTELNTRVTSSVADAATASVVLWRARSGAASVAARVKSTSDALI